MLVLPALICCLVAVAAARYFSTYSNPVSFFSIGLAIPLLSQASIDLLPVDWDLLIGLYVQSNSSSTSYAIVMAATLTGLAAFCLPWLLWREKTAVGGGWPPKDEKRNWGWIASPAFSGMVAVLLVMCASYTLGQLPILAMFEGALDVQQLDSTLNRLPPGLLAGISLFTTIFILDFVFEKFNGAISRKNTIYFLMLCIILALWNAKRQQLLFLLVIFCATYLYRWDTDQRYRFGRYHFSPYALALLLFILLVGIFVLVDQIRYSEGSSRAFSILAYLTWPTLNLLSLADNLGFGGLGLRDEAAPFVFTELLPSRFGGKDNVTEMGDMLFEPTSPSGFIGYWWLDGGVIFIFLGAFLFGCFSRWAYQMRLRSRAQWQLFTLMLWVCLSSGIYSHFIAMVYFWLPMLYLVIRSKIVAK